VVAGHFIVQIAKSNMTEQKKISLSPEQVASLIAEQKVLLIDKPSGMSSHSVVNGVRRQTGIKRVGHAGTLDPLATGLLIVLVGRETTRLQDFFMHQDKTYQFTAVLGHETDTYDLEGKVVQTWPTEEVQQVTEDQVRQVLQQFVGEYDQQVPAFSAVKVQGKKLYELARQGKVEKLPEKLPSRRVKIYSLKLLSFKKSATQVTFQCEVKCGSGTYVRSLAVDIGRALKIGATVIELRRTEIGNFSVDTAPKWLG
jgi:tRNA pseudouridine55 synthase